MVFVTMCDEDRPQLVRLLAQVRDVGQDEIDAELILMREADSAVYDDQVIRGLETEHVATDLGETTEEDQSNVT
jgi:hypothetical protein